MGASFAEVSGQERIVLGNGRYELRSRLGRGAHGEVWAALDRLRGETVAIELLDVPSRGVWARVRREIPSLRAVQAPGVARLLDEGVDAGRRLPRDETRRRDALPRTRAALRSGFMPIDALALAEALAESPRGCGCPTSKRVRSDSRGRRSTVRSERSSRTLSSCAFSARW